MTYLPLSFCVSSLISSISGVTSKSLPPAEILHLPSLLRLQQPTAVQSTSPDQASHTAAPPSFCQTHLSILCPGTVQA